jgi:hypothetical protein
MTTPAHAHQAQRNDVHMPSHVHCQWLRNKSRIQAAWAPTQSSQATRRYRITHTHTHTHAHTRTHAHLARRRWRSARAARPSHNAQYDDAVLNLDLRWCVRVHNLARDHHATRAHAHVGDRARMRMPILLHRILTRCQVIHSSIVQALPFSLLSPRVCRKWQRTSAQSHTALKEV